MSDPAARFPANSGVKRAPERPFPSNIRSGVASGNGRDDGDGLAVGDLGVEALEEPNVVVGDEHVDEAAQSVLVEQALLEARVGALEVADHLADCGPFDLDLGLAAGESAQSGGDTDLHAHERTITPTSGSSFQVLDIVRPVRSVPPALRTYHHADFELAELRSAKVGHVVSVCLPARNEATTVGAIVETIRAHLVDGCSLVDEILVVDDHSTDATARVAADAGARVIAAADVLPDHGEGHGKGAAMWKSLAEADGDIVVWCDADVIGFESHFVTGLLGPLLTRPEIGFVKGFYERPVADAGDRGGRVTELVARPMLSLLFPHLTSIVQPLAGEYAGRREVLERLPFVEGYGVDIALLIDIADRIGTAAMAQVDLGRRVHRNRPLDELSPQATAILQTMLARAGRPVPAVTTLHRPGLDPLEVEVVERPPLRTVTGCTDERRGA